MGFYTRKSISFGGLRFTLSNSGINTSVGVKGFRFGKGPRGNYVHIGRKGIYYRAVIDKKKNKHKSLQNSPEPVNISDSTGLMFNEIESAEVSGIVDSSSSDIVKELNEKHSRMSFWPFMFIAVFIPNAGFYLALFLSIAVYLFIDRRRKTTVLFYDIEDEAEADIQKFYDGFHEIEQCRKMWHVSAQAVAGDKKYSAGADYIVKRTDIKLQMKAPRHVVTNVKVPSIPVGKQTLYFFPDRIFIYDATKVGGLLYENLDISVRNQRFVESGAVPSDGKVVDRTWEYVNKKGGPDKRFKNNRELPILLYTEMDFSSSFGLNERIQISRPDIGNELINRLREYKSEKFLK